MSRNTQRGRSRLARSERVECILGTSFCLCIQLLLVNCTQYSTFSYQSAACRMVSLLHTRTDAASHNFYAPWKSEISIASLRRSSFRKPRLLTSIQFLQVLYSVASLRTLPLYPADVLLADCVPCAHVFFHACREAVFFAFGEGCAGLGNAALEAVFVEFLWYVGKCIYK